MSFDPHNMFGIPGTFDPTESWPSDEQHLHQGGLDQIAPASDQFAAAALSGAYGQDPYDVFPSEFTQGTIEKELPQWGPPFIKFVDDRITDLEKKVIKELEKWQFQTRTDFFNVGMQTDASGNITPQNDKSVLYAPPPGFTFALHRIFIGLDGATFGTPFTGAGDFWELRINGEAIDGGSLVSGQGSLPLNKYWGTRDALRVRDGEILSIFVQGVTVNKRMFVKGQGSLDRTIEG